MKWNNFKIFVCREVACKVKRGAKNFGIWNAYVKHQKENIKHNYLSNGKIQNVENIVNNKGDE